MTITKELPNIHIVKANENSYIIYFSNDISPQIFTTVRYFCQALKKQKTHAFTHIIPAYNNVLVSYEKPSLSPSVMIGFLRDTVQKVLEKSNTDELENSGKKHYLPAYYHHEVGMDIDKVLQRCNLSSLEQLIALHSGTEYTVYAVGFCPGFAYLAEVNEKLSIPRHQSPRLSVPSGSIAIAELQTAIYPTSTPGGWHIIGNCPLSLTPKQNNLNTLWQIADKVVFEPINRKTYQKLGGKITKAVNHHE